MGSFPCVCVCVCVLLCTAIVPQVLFARSLQGLGWMYLLSERIFFYHFRAKLSKFMAPRSLDHPNPGLNFLGSVSPQPQSLMEEFFPCSIYMCSSWCQSNIPFGPLGIWEGRYISHFLLLWGWHCFSGEGVFCGAPHLGQALGVDFWFLHEWNC